jgi:hypothetical protein
MKREIKEALDEIAQGDPSGRLQAQAVVERAKPRASILHQCFTWDDSKAGALYRLEEARGLIRRYSVVIEQQPPVTTRAYVSLKSVRLKGGGYTPIQRILSERELYEEMRQNALEELAVMQKRYGHIADLQGVFREADRVRARVGRAKQHAHAHP